MFNRNRKKKEFFKQFDNISSEGYVFIHIPKNAGTSIYKSLGMDKTRHYTVKEYVKMLGDSEYDKLFSFAFVRNPFSRFLSLYNYARLEESYYHSAIKPEESIHGKHMDYDLLANANLEEAATLLVEGKLVHNPPHRQWNPQSFWLKDSNDALRVKYLGRFEDLDFHMQNVFRMINRMYPSQLQKINSSGMDPNEYRKHITPDVRRILESYYKEDLERFNYDF